jgi:hypothetical protein
VSAPASPDYRSGYARGYNAGQRRRVRETDEDAARAASATYLLECLVGGLVEQGLSIDEILDAQLIGAKEKARDQQDA